jgi:hypothetical protein
MSEKEWIQAEPDFVEKYEEWKKKQAQFGELATKKSVYATNSPTPATNILKNQMKSSTRFSYSIAKSIL